MSKQNLRSFKTFGIKSLGIKSLGIALSWIQVWCKRFEGDKRCNNFRLLT